MSMVFHHTRVEDYNWNYLDQHICGHSDFEELGEVRESNHVSCLMPAVFVELVQCNLDYPDPFVHRLSAATPDK